MKGTVLLQERYARLDDIAAPNSYVVAPTESDLSYVRCFSEMCKRYCIDFATADEDERDFVMRMAEKMFRLGRA